MGYSRRAPLSERFWAKVNKNGPIPLHQPALGSCWLWMGKLKPNGYGRFGFNRIRHYAHRVSWELNRGEIPDGLCVLHQCDTPSCVRPDHLFLGTDADNHADCIAKGRHRYGDNHPNRIHPERVSRGDAHWTHRRPEHRTRGARIYGAKLTEQDIPAIRARCAAQEDFRQIAADYNVTISNISAIWRRKSWRHVP